MEVAAFHPLPYGKRLVSVALFLAFAPAARPAHIRGRALPGIPLCGARTFLSPERSSRQRRSGRLRSRNYKRWAPSASRQRTCSPARKGTIVSSPYGSASVPWGRSARFSPLQAAKPAHCLKRHKCRDPHFSARQWAPSPYSLVSIARDSYKPAMKCGVCALICLFAASP